MRDTGQSSSEKQARRQCCTLYKHTSHIASNEIVLKYHIAKMISLCINFQDHELVQQGTIEMKQPQTYRRQVFNKDILKCTWQTSNVVLVCQTSTTLQGLKSFLFQTFSYLSTLTLIQIIIQPFKSCDYKPLG